MVVLWLGLSLLSSVSKHNIWLCYNWVRCCCRSSVNTICGCIWVDLSLLSSVSKHNVIVLWLGLLLLSSISKHNMWSYYGWVCRCCRPSLSTICGRIMVGFVFVVLSVSKHNMLSYYCWVCRKLSSGSKHNMLSYYGWICRCCRPSVNTICGRFMVGFVVVVASQ